MKELKAVSKVIELKPHKKYLFVFDTRYTTKEDAMNLMNMLGDLKVKGVGFVIENEKGLKVIEK